jgi:ABC-type Fe3+/spermidine/putrescine transport system ATPase subunit
LRTKAKKPVETGQQIHITVRPERVIFTEKEDQNHCSYEGTVVDVIYLGDVTKYYVQLSHVPRNEGKEVVIMKVQNRLGTKKYARGDQVKIGWNHMDATIV